MDLELRLAIVLSCTNTACQVKFLESDAQVTAEYSAGMRAHHIHVEAGHLVAVDYAAHPTRMVYRWDDIEIDQTTTGYALFQHGRPLDAATLRAEFFPMIQARYAQGQTKSRLNWMDVSDLSFNNFLLLERVQLSWFPGWLPEPELAIALRANPAVAWFMRHKCPEIADWVNSMLAKSSPEGEITPDAIRQAELAVLRSIEDLLVYAVDPAAYDAQPFLMWDSRELTDLVDFAGKIVVDVGSGTGRLAFVAAQTAKTVYAVEPVGNLRAYLKVKAKRKGLSNVFVVDGLITDLPFPDNFADVTMEGHVFGDNPEQEHLEMERITKTGGMVIHCPGTGDRDNDDHKFLVSQGYTWSRFEEPYVGMLRKYWKKCI